MCFAQYVLRSVWVQLSFQFENVCEIYEIYINFAQKRKIMQLTYFCACHVGSDYVCKI